MPPEDNKFKIGIDPIFKGNTDQSKKPAGENPSAFNVLNNQQYVPGRPNDFSNQGQIPNKTNENKSIIRTFKSDVESAILTNHLSSINIAIAENQKKQEQLKIEETAPEIRNSFSKGKIIIFISTILILAGVLALGVTFIFNRQNSRTDLPVQELPSLITTEYKDELNASLLPKNKFASTLGSKINDIQIPVNNLYNPYITTGTSTNRRLITATEFTALMNFKMPDIIKRTLLPDFMVGMYAFGKNLPFLILKSSYFENAYAGMFEWEKYLEKDFQVLFRFSGYENAGKLLEELTPTNQRKFEDAVIINKDVRVLKNAEGEMTLLYGIIDKETIVITVSDTAFKEVINRLNKEKGLKR